MTDDKFEGTEWNTAQQRTSFIGQVTNELRVAYYKAKKDKSQENVWKYHSTLDALLQDTWAYLNIDEEEKQEISEKLDELENWIHTSNHRQAFKKLRDLDRRLQQHLASSGLGIPRKKGKEKGMEMLS